MSVLKPNKLFTALVMPLTMSVPIPNASLPIANPSLQKPNIIFKALQTLILLPNNSSSKRSNTSSTLPKTIHVPMQNLSLSNIETQLSMSKKPLSKPNILLGIPKNSLNKSESSPQSQRLSSHRVSNLTRKKRYNYEDVYEWPPGDSTGYDFDANYAAEELTLWQEVGRNWQVVAMRSIFYFSILAFFTMIFGFICYVNCAVCIDSLSRAVTPWAPAVEWLKTWYEDPMYIRAKEIADAFGIQLDYATFQKIKETHEFGGRAGWNPANLE